MTGTLYIGGLDAFVHYGVFVLEGGYNGLVSFPPLKNVDSNDWPEEDGIEPDLSDPKLDTREFSISFGCVDTVKTDNFLSMLSDGAYHEFDFRQIGCIHTLRMVSQPDKQTWRALEKFSLQFADDFPLNGYSYLPPVPVASVSQRGYEINDVDLSNYGVWILEGSLDQIRKVPAVKKNLLISNNSISGAIYDGQSVVFQQKDVMLKCGIVVDDIVLFWRNYNALLYDLSRSDERMFYVRDTEETYPCYYKSSQVSRFSLIGDRVWCEFSLTLVFTSFRIGEVDYLLATENGELIVTEDEQYFIDLR